jgi:hypothetical protein
MYKLFENNPVSHLSVLFFPYRTERTTLWTDRKGLGRPQLRMGVTGRWSAPPALLGIGAGRRPWRSVAQWVGMNPAPLGGHNASATRAHSLRKNIFSSKQRRHCFHADSKADIVIRKPNNFIQGEIKLKLLAILVYIYA